MLNEMGEEGWEFVSMHDDYGIFKRPKPLEKRFRF